MSSSASKLTLSEIARRAGVSRQVVGKVLNGGTVTGCNASEKTRERIEGIAREGGYRPNLAAQTIARGRFNCLGLIRSTSVHSSALPVPMLDGIQEALAERSMHLALATLPDEALTDGASLPRILQTQMCDGLLVDYTDHVPEGLERIIDHHRIPAVWVNRKLPLDAVYPEERAAGVALTRHLIEQGHRSIGYVDLNHPVETLSDAHYSAHDREAGYALAVRESGIRPVVLRPSMFVHAPERAAWLESRLRQPDARGMTALVLYGDADVAHHVTRMSKRSSGWPVLGFRTRRDVWHGQMTFWQEPTREVGRRAVELLLARLDATSPLDSVPVLGRFCSPDAVHSPADPPG